MKDNNFMSGGVKSFLVLMFIPFLLAATHDVYLNYFSDNEKILRAKSLQIDPNDFLVSDLGWVFHHYTPQGMDMARDMIEPKTWKKKIDPVLRLPTMVVGIIPFMFGIIYSLLAFVLGIWPFAHYRKIRKEKVNDFVVYKHAKSKSTEYTKK